MTRDGLTLRDRYTGCEDLSPDFLLPYTDHQARLYSSTLSRWMVPDPLSEKYYGISPYAYCGGNPMAAVDIWGLAPSTHILEDGTVFSNG